MQTTTVHSLFRFLLTIYFGMAIQFNALAQDNVTTSTPNAPYLTWDSQVGCVTYDSQGNPSDPRKRLYLTQDVENGPCIRFCEGSNVNLTVNGNNISNVLWSVSGGTLLSTSGTNNTEANVEWGTAGSGALNVIITFNDNSHRNITICIEKINGPDANFEILNPGATNEFCLNSPVNFHNLSVNAGSTYNLWSFGDGHYSNEVNPTHSYLLPGLYPVTLVVTNDCGCKAKISIEIKVVNTHIITIDCPSVVCEGNKSVYTVQDCGGHWTVTGGTITTSTATEVHVTWDHVGNDGFGTVNYLSDCTCPFWNTVRIPIIQKVGFIEGPQTLCLNDQGLYSLPQWPSTQFNWTLLNGSTNSGNLVFTDQRNQVYLDAVDPGTYTLKCHYVNTLLGCGGDAELTITVVPGIEISGSDAICSNNITTYTNSTGGIVDWELMQGNVVVASTTAATFQYNFPAGGVYTLTATVNGGCAGQPKVINVTPTPDTPTGPVLGATLVCPGVPYEYTLANMDPDTILVWNIPAADGTIQGDNTGNTVSIIFNNTVSGNYLVSITRQSLSGLSCVSQPLTFNVTKINVVATITNGSALTSFCPSSQTTFTATYNNGITPDLVEWYVDPVNFGNIISGGNTNTVTVSWNEITASASGHLKLRVRTCGNDQIFDTPILLQAAPVLTLTGPTAICYGGNLDFTLAVTGATTGTVTWEFGNGVTEITPMNSTSMYSFPNPYLNNTGSNINYNVIATLSLPNGCSHSVAASQNVIVYPKTTITVTPGYNYEVCPTSYTPILLSANATTGTSVTVGYQWYKGSSQITVNGTSSTYTISGSSPGGVYHVKVTDSNSCVVNSQNITVTESCGPIPTCEITPDPNVTLTASLTDCGTITAQLSYTGTATVEWLESPFISLVSGNTTGAEYNTNTPGTHLIIVKVTFQTSSGPCVVVRSVEVTKHYKASFNTIVTCNSGSGTYNVSLVSNATVFNVTSPITYTFSGTGMTTQTGETVNLTNLSPGTYTFHLTLSMAGQPDCSVIKYVILQPMPDVNFTLLPTTYCAEDPISLTIPNYNAANTYVWHFFNTSFIASSAVTQVNINSQGNYNITLEVTTPQLCSFTSSNGAQVTINKASFPGQLTASPISICQGDPLPVISFVPDIGNSSMPSSYNWMSGNQQVATSINNSFTPAASGSYWAQLIDVHGCKYSLPGNIAIVIRQRPYVSISGSTNICDGQQGTLQGIIANPSLERRWLLNSTPVSGPLGLWSVSTPLTINVPIAPGTYEYTLEVRPANDTSCGNSASASVTVNPPLNPPALSYTVDQCEPYQVTVIASGASQGFYNWSTGDTGDTITVDHGGAVGVTYTDEVGCTVAASITIPQPPDRSLWVFPTGCYDFCLYTEPQPFLIGPLGVFDSFTWWQNSYHLYGTNSTVPNFPVNQAGVYQLNLENDGCTFTSGIMNIAPDLEGCEIEPCDFKWEIQHINAGNGAYYISGYISNLGSVPITVSLISYNNYGTYSPNSVVVPPYSTYTFSPLTFTPNSTFPGTGDILVAQMPGCMKVIKLSFPAQPQTRIAQTDGQPEEATLVVAPNPANDFTNVTYDLGNQYKHAENLTVFSLLGLPVMTQKLDASSGTVILPMAGLPAGTYIVNVQADGIRAMQQVLVKK